MLGLLQAITTLIAALSPVVTINPDERGVLVRLGKINRQLAPGLYFKWPVFDQIEKRSVVDTIADLNTQSLITKDLKTVTVSGRLRYRIVNITKAHFAVFDIDEALIEECETAVADVVMGCTLQELAQHHKAKSTVLGLIDEAVAEWGIDAQDFSFTNLTPCRAMRLMQE